MIVLSVGSGVDVVSFRAGDGIWCLCNIVRQRVPPGGPRLLIFIGGYPWTIYLLSVRLPSPPPPLLTTCLHTAHTELPIRTHHHPPNSHNPAPLYRIPYPTLLPYASMLRCWAWLLMLLLPLLLILLLFLGSTHWMFLLMTSARGHCDVTGRISSILPHRRGLAVRGHQEGTEGKEGREGREGGGTREWRVQLQKFSRKVSLLQILVDVIFLSSNILCGGEFSWNGLIAN